MKRKKIKINYKNLFILLIVLGLISYGVYFTYNKLTNNDTKIEEKEENKTIKKLTSLGYSKNDAEIIISNMKDSDINKIDKKYDNLAEYSKVKYFHIENIDRYNKLKEKNNNYSTEEIIMRVNVNVDKPYYTDIKTVENPENLTVLVNKYYALSSEFEPNDLIKVGSQRMRKEAGEAMNKLLKDINNEGIYLQAQSGYRTYELQETLYNRYVNKDGKELADTYSARPGNSEHQTGLVMDVSHDGTLEKTFENTKQFTWLSENAYKYGFILRFPKDKVDITGYDYEPWHYRYVGIETATLIHNENLTLEEYLVKYEGLY